MLQVQSRRRLAGKPGGPEPMPGQVVRGRPLMLRCIMRPDETFPVPMGKSP
jgi:hypothetical protein